jgi:hypothetical protein
MISPSFLCPSQTMKKMFFLSGSAALVQALLIFVTGAFETYNSYRYAIAPTTGYEHTGGSMVLVTPFVLFLVAFYFLFFLTCSLACAVLVLQRKYLRICFALTLVVGSESVFDAWVLCLRHDYGWIWIPAARILFAVATLYLLSRPHALCEQVA